MPPHLHPRSRVTTSLFATTLVASFVVVGLPHIFPCPVPRNELADSGALFDSEGRRINRRRRRRKLNDSSTQEEGEGGTRTESDYKIEFAPHMTIEEEAKMLERQMRECPVPKPGGLLGELLGFTKQDANETGDGRERRQPEGIKKPLSGKDLDERGR